MSYYILTYVNMEGEDVSSKKYETQRDALYAGISAIAAGCEHNLYVEADEGKNRRPFAQFIARKRVRTKLGIDDDLSHAISDADIWALVSEYERK
mgnify:FL=1